MAISAGAAGAWAAVNATTQTVTLPTHSSGQIIVLIAACKAATPASLDIQVTTPSSGWHKVASFADGTTASGVGVGSVTQAIFWREATSGAETNPVVTWGGSQTAAPGLAVALTFNKAGGDVWNVPAVVQAATNNATSISVTMGSNPGITSGDWGVITHTTRDDSALTVPTWTATSATLAAVVVYPTTPIASGTSNDMAGTSAYRSVTSGTASAAPVVTGTQAAAETGVTGFIRLRSSTAAPQTATPTTLALVTATFEPTVTILAPQLVTPTTAALVTATFAPTVSTPVLVTPTTSSLATATFAPVIALAVTPTAAALTTTTFAPTVSATNHQTVTPTAATLTTATFEPTVTAPALVTPDAGSLALTTFAPTVTATAHQTVTPDPAALITATFAPTVTAPALATPDPAALVTSTFAPTVSATAHVTVTPTTAALVTSTFAPVVTGGAGLTVTPITATLALASFAPDVVLTDNLLVTPGAAALALTSFAPVVIAIAPVTVTPTTAALVLAALAPTVNVTGPIDHITGTLVLGPVVNGSVTSAAVRSRLTVNPSPIHAEIDVE